MLLYSTLLPVRESLTRERFVRLVIEWNRGSSHAENVIPGLAWDGVSYNVRFEGERVWLQIEEYRDGNIIAVRFEKEEDDGVIWDTDYVMNFDERQISVRLDRSYREDALSGEETFSVPVFIELLIRGGYAEEDGGLAVESVPLEIDEENLSLAADVINGAAPYRLPVVYVSKSFDGEDAVDVVDMAKRLKGVAHVLVQEDARTGPELMQMTDGRNEYDGAVGIYFPNPAVEHRKYLRHDFPGSRERMTEMVVRTVQRYSLVQRMDGLYTWSGVNNAILLAKYSSKREELAAAESARQASESEARQSAQQAEESRQEAEQSREEAEQSRRAADESRQDVKEHRMLLAYADDENAGLRQDIESLTKQIESLRREVEGLRGRLEGMSEKPLLYYGGEEDFFAGEIREFALMALVNERARTEAGTRKAEVLGDLIRGNGGLQGLAKKRSEELKSILRGYSRMTDKIERGLKALGFTVTKDGGHYKLRYHNDGRYTGTLAATPSDHRTWENTAGDIIRKMF